MVAEGVHGALSAICDIGVGAIAVTSYVYGKEGKEEPRGSHPKIKEFIYYGKKITIYIKSFFVLTPLRNYVQHAGA